MPDINNYKEVDFNKWCEKCDHKSLKEFKSPCNECLEEPVRIGTDKPLYFEKPNPYK